MRKRVDIAERLKELGVDPLEGMVRIARRAEENGNLALSAKILSDLLEYTAPKLKSMEVAIEPATMDFLDRQARLERIQQLMMQIGLGETAKAINVIEGETRPVLQHKPDPP